MMRFFKIFSFSLALIFALCASPMVQASDLDGGRGFPDETDQSRLFNIPGAGFNSAGNYDAEVYFFSFGSGRIEGRGVHPGCIMAPVTLPTDANIYAFYASFYDDDASDYVWMDLWRIQNYTGVVEKITRINTSADSSSPQSSGTYDIPREFVEVDALNYSYYVTTCIGETTQGIYSVRVWYRPDAIFSDGFEAGNYSAWSSVTPG